MKLLKYIEALKNKIDKAQHEIKDAPLPQQRLRDQTPFPSKQAPLYLEVGCGVGLHPILFAKKRPQAHLIACERTSDKFHKFKKRLENHQLENITAIHEDGMRWLTHWAKESKLTFEKIFFLYPNPYPKNNQRNKRFFAMPLFKNYLHTLKLGGEIEMRTNQLFYLEEAKILATEVWNLECQYCGPLREESEKGITHFERKYLKREETCYELILKKTSSTF